MNRVCITLLLCCLSSCRMNKTERMEMSEDSIDTVRIDQGVGKKTVSDSLKIGIADDGDCLQRQLLAIHEELGKRLNNTPYTHIQRNVTGYGVGLHCIDIDLMVNTPERQKEFREKIMDSPVFCFHGVEVPVINERVGRNHIRGIHIRPEYPVFSTKAAQATFILSNHSGGDLTCGEHYYLTFEDEKGTWRELPINAAFWDIAYVLRDGEERVMKASLYPDVHPNKPGRYRYFYEITIRRKPVLMMAEFRLSDNEKEWKEAKRTPLPEGLLTMKQDNTHQTVGEQVEELVYDMVEVMPEFPGGVRAMLDFIKKNIQYPEIARKNGIQGRVIVGVVVDKNGSVTNLTILKSIDPYLDKEAIRVIRLMPKWKPGTQMDKPVKVKYAIPVSCFHTEIRLYLKPYLKLCFSICKA